ncbi:glycosyltransferase family 2 protein [Marinoscillum furvescens]|uniref:Glycosyltransferase involved in cell wall biosynthesis n=1 Tax=Marinoscillum furvescens DSM 4134 TaxID=1122208 RepID=A0A3D9L3C7_MARFU|nr:glycosyltransferase family 2 protein [Marinoscillum furvescens]RED99553.1 glycosyltransferase involved in cell wall biosynthesis [Marinoscillum furvescens DSM 4134]
MKPLVTIITPIYNGEKYLAETISSVINQTYEHWELLLIDDGSTDLSLDIAQSFTDQRIRVFNQKNNGVGSARNVGLNQMNGDYFCFLDADDILPPTAISRRLEKFQKDESLSFVDGVVSYVDDQLIATGKKYVPSFSGQPLDRLLALDRQCLFGNTWMIKKRSGIQYQFDEEMTHAEDLYFYITICNQHNGKYGFVTDEVLWYRQTGSNSMKNLKGLEDGYNKLLKRIRKFRIGSKFQRIYLAYRITRIMTLSHLFDGRDAKSAVRCLFKYWM